MAELDSMILCFPTIFKFHTSVNGTASLCGESSHHSPFTYKDLVSLNAHMQTTLLKHILDGYKSKQMHWLYFF